MLMKYKDKLENVPVNLQLLTQNTWEMDKGGKKPVTNNCF